MDITIFLTVTLLFAAAFPLILGIGGLMRDKHIKTQGVKTNATVVAFKYAGNTAAPVVEYQTEKGLVRVKSWFGMSLQLYSFKVGDTIQIYYDPDHIKRFRIVGSHISTVMFSVALVMGIITLALAFIVPGLIA